MRKKRYEMGLFQREVAEKIGIDKTTIFNWENGLTQPKIRSMPKIFEFLGYIPSVAMSPVSPTLGDRIIAYRKSHGLSQKKLARQIGVDPGTLGRWEKDMSVPCRRMLDVMELPISISACATGPTARFTYDIANEDHLIE